MEISRQLDGRTGVSSGAGTTLTRALIACGFVAGPLFYLVALGQILTRPGFDIRRHAISLLSLGDLGWVQIASFLVTGSLLIAFAAGMRRTLHGGKGGTWGPRLVAVFGAGTFAAGIFHPDPGLGFPPGAPAGMPTTMTWHASIHELSFMVAFVAVIAACFVFSRRFAALGQRAWAAYSIVSAVAAPVLIIAAMSIPAWVGVLIACGAAVSFGWVAALAVRLSAEARAA